MNKPEVTEIKTSRGLPGLRSLHRGRIVTAWITYVDGRKLLSEAIEGKETTCNTLIIAEEEEIQTRKSANGNLELRAPKAQEILTLTEHTGQKRDDSRTVARGCTDGKNMKRLVCFDASEEARFAQSGNPEPCVQASSLARGWRSKIQGTETFQGPMVDISINHDDV